MISPLIWTSIPFEDKDAWYDFLRMHDQQHRALAIATGTRWNQLDDLRENGRPHQQMHDAVAKALGIPFVDDLESFDLNDENSFIAFHFLNSSDHVRLNTAAGVK